MSRRYKVVLLALLAGWLSISTVGCTAFRPMQPQQSAPRTVEEWMAQPRVEP